MSNLFLTMMDRMGVQVEHFGDSTGRSRPGSQLGFARANATACSSSC